MSIAKRLHGLYQDKYLQLIYRRRLNRFLSTLQQNTMKSKSQLRREAVMSSTLREGETIVFGVDSIEALEEKKRKEDQAAEIGRMH
jgi:hypothetical protein